MGLHGPTARPFELIIPDHRPLAWTLPGDRDTEVDDGLPAVDDEDPVPPTAVLAEFEAHGLVYVCAELATSLAFTPESRTFRPKRSLGLIT
jgi:hypothetical protein